MLDSLYEWFGLELPPFELLILDAGLGPVILLFPGLQDSFSLVNQSPGIIELLLCVIAQVEQFGDVDRALDFVAYFVGDQGDEVLHFVVVLVVSGDDPHHLEPVHQAWQGLLNR